MSRAVEERRNGMQGENALVQGTWFSGVRFECYPRQDCLRIFSARNHASPRTQPPRGARSNRFVATLIAIAIQSQASSENGKTQGTDTGVTLLL